MDQITFYCITVQYEEKARVFFFGWPSKETACSDLLLGFRAISCCFGPKTTIAGWRTRGMIRAWEENKRRKTMWRADWFRERARERGKDTGESGNGKGQHWNSACVLHSRKNSPSVARNQFGTKCWGLWQAARRRLWNTTARDIGFALACASAHFFTLSLCKLRLGGEPTASLHSAQGKKIVMGSFLWI